jgi:hypothetical protein
VQQEPRPAIPWKPVAIVLALVLVAVLICMALIVTGVMKLGFSLL